MRQPSWVASNGCPGGGLGSAAGAAAAAAKARRWRQARDASPRLPDRVPLSTKGQARPGLAGVGQALAAGAPATASLR